MTGPLRGASAVWRFLDEEGREVPVTVYADTRWPRPRAFTSPWAEAWRLGRHHDPLSALRPSPRRP